MKKILKIFAVAAALALIPVTAQAIDVNMIANKIELATMKAKLHPVNCEKSPFDVYILNINSFIYTLISQYEYIYILVHILI